MKKLIRFIKDNRKVILKSVVLGLAAIIAFEIGHNYATMERRYIAYGGEIFIPFLIIFGKKIWAVVKENFAAIKIGE